MTSFARPAVMGVLNTTPDSFSDGGAFLEPAAALAHAEQMREEGADLIDVGGESTRPGAVPVDADEELRRVLPVIEALGAAGLVPVSIDTSKAVVARAAIAAGAVFVNDVTALRGDPAMAAAVAEAGTEVCLMHMRGEPRTMQDDPTYDDVVSDVKAFLEERLSFAVREGIAEERVWLDPGIGFGKTLHHNLELLRRLDEIVAVGRPGPGGRLPEAVPRLAHREGRARPGRRDRGGQRDRLRARGAHVPRARRGTHPGCPGGGGCYRGRHQRRGVGFASNKVISRRFHGQLRRRQRL